MTSKSQHARRWIIIAGVAAAVVTAAIIVGLTLTPRTVAIEIINEGTTPDEATFEPLITTVVRGTTVVWINTDASVHTATSTEPAGIFDSGVMQPEEVFAFGFDNEGTFDYFCAIHPAMTGIVIVQ